MANKGCGPTAMSMVTSKLTGKKITPDQMALLSNMEGTSGDKGTRYDFIDKASEDFGINASRTTKPKENNIKNSVKNGPVILSGTDDGTVKNSAFTRAGHYVVATGENPDGTINVQDPRGPAYNSRFSPEQLAKQASMSWKFGESNSKDKGAGYFGANEGSDITNLLNIGANEKGYLEKASNSKLDDKTVNAGANNYTKYGKWYGLNGPSAPWCHMFVSWVANQAKIPDNIIPKTADTGAGYNFFKKKKRIFTASQKDPQAGDLFYHTPGPQGHVGIVKSFNKSKGTVTTIEGNTSSGMTGSNDGGAAMIQDRPLSYTTYFARPDYKNTNEVLDINTDSSSDSNNDGSTSSDSSTSSSESSGNIVSDIIGSLGNFASSLVGQKSDSDTTSSSDSSSDSSTTDGSSPSAVTGSTTESGSSSRFVPKTKENVMSYMDWKIIKNKGSYQYTLKNNAEGYDKKGFGKIGDRYTVAVKPYYGDVGEYLNIGLENGKSIKAVVADIKSTENGTTGDAKYIHSDGSIVEWVVDGNGATGTPAFPGYSKSAITKVGGDARKRLPDYYSKIQSINNVGSFWKDKGIPKTITDKKYDLTKKDKSGAGWGAGDGTKNSYNVSFKPNSKIRLGQPALVSRTDYFSETSKKIQNAMNAADISAKNNLPYDKILSLLESIAINTGISAQATKELVEKGISTTMQIENEGTGNVDNSNNVVNIQGGSDTNLFTGNQKNVKNDALLNQIRKIASGE